MLYPTPIRHIKHNCEDPVLSAGRRQNGLAQYGQYHRGV